METKAMEAFLKNHYSDEKLAALLAHAEDGKLSYTSCCCLVGVATANHPLRKFLEYDGDSGHCLEARVLSGGQEAEKEFLQLGQDDPERRARIIPIIQAEIARRDKLAREREWKEDLVATCS